MVQEALEQLREDRKREIANRIAQYILTGEEEIERLEAKIVKIRADNQTWLDKDIDNVKIYDELRKFV